MSLDIGFVEFFGNQNCQNYLSIIYYLYKLLYISGVVVPAFSTTSSYPKRKKKQIT